MEMNNLWIGIKQRTIFERKYYENPIYAVFDCRRNSAWVRKKLKWN